MVAQSDVYALPGEDKASSVVLSLASSDTCLSSQNQVLTGNLRRLRQEPTSAQFNQVCAGMLRLFCGGLRTARGPGSKTWNGRSSEAKSKECNVPEKSGARGQVEVGGCTRGFVGRWQKEKI